MKIEKRNLVTTFLLMFCLGAIQPIQAQLLKRLKKKIENKTIQKAEEETDKLLNGKPSKNKKQTKGTENKTVENKGRTAQISKNKHNTVIYDDSDLLVFTSPISGFKDVTVQKINKLPRLGLTNSYMEKFQHPDTSKEIRDKRMKINYNGFHILMKIYAMRDYFETMDKTYLTPSSNNPSQSDAKSVVAQRLLLDFASQLATQKTILKYFCDQPQQDGSCNYGGNWGGKNADSFSQNEKYTAFVTEHLDAILKWSESFFETTQGDLYYVTKTKIQDYDFDNDGYWVPLPIRHKTIGTAGEEVYFMEYAPETPYEEKIQNKLSDNSFYNAIVLLKVNAETAEKKLSEWNTKELFFVSKTKIVFKEFYINGLFFDRPSYTYHYTNPIIEVYTNEGLNDKVGQINLNELKFKAE